MADFALAASELAACLQQTCSANELDLAAKLQGDLWFARRARVPTIEELPACTITACYKEELLNRYLRCAWVSKLQHACLTQ